MLGHGVRAASRWLAAKVRAYWQWLLVAIGVALLWRRFGPRTRPKPLDHERRMREAEDSAREATERARLDRDARLTEKADELADAVRSETHSIRAQSERVRRDPKSLNRHLYDVSARVRKDGESE